MKEELAEKAVQVAIGVPMTAGITYLSWKYPGLAHKYVWDKAVERALIRFGKATQYGAYFTAEEVNEYIWQRWATRTMAGRAVGLGARALGYGFGIWAIVDSYLLVREGARIYDEHMQMLSPEGQMQATKSLHFGLMR